MNTATYPELLEIAKRQKQLISLIGVYILGYILIGFLAVIVGPNAVIVVQILGSVLYVGVVIAYIYIIFKLAGALKLIAWLFIIAAIIPLVNLIVLLSLNSRSTGILKKNGIKVGLFGANESQILHLRAQSNMPEATQLPQCPACGQPAKRSWNSCPKCGKPILKNEI